ncbi:hypothetical protein ONS95_006428 [Cadophora gregata]|uniref:uncharacterized protein n=1 Tax=Cadophora gregata TaxID=51156 RepID=UPI0026DAEFBD|nr:uncharacterized protein ONS95_006428 [Cadophora gregata]KAK0101249.1 hypothetical protein ONS95_006428 [Cadophora gregata]KAK0106738.1 hypothetical protein ONS96_004356 [Cadophora gregata f. sp. sojae]
MAAQYPIGGGFRPNDWEDHNPLSSSSLDTPISSNFYWPSPSSPQSSDFFPFPFPIWDRHKPSSDPPPLRTIEELHLERTYLIDSLHVQAQTATQLMHKIPILESKLLQHHLRPAHRKIRKQLGWVKSRLGQCRQQEQTICARLEQLAGEIQRREQWAQKEQEEGRNGLDVYRREQDWGYQQGVSDGLEMGRWRERGRMMSLDPEQPEFRPQGLFPCMFWPPPSGQQEQEEQGVEGCTREDMSEYISEPPRGESEERAEKESTICEKYNSHALSLSRRSASVDGVDFRLLATHDLLVPDSTLKRHSFPGCLGI